MKSLLLALMLVLGVSAHVLAQQAGPYAAHQWGLPGDVPLVADFDGDGLTDLTVWRPSNGTWYIRYSSSGYSFTNYAAYQWGLLGDVPLAADFNGDGQTDLVVYRPSEGMWYVRFLAGGGTLPKATHPLFFGYMLDQSPFGNFRSEIASYTNAVHVWSYYWLADRAGHEADLQSAAASGKTIIWGPNQSPSDTTLTSSALASLDVAAPYWPRISLVFFDELSMSRAGVDAYLLAWQTAVQARGLSPKPIAVNFTDQQITTGTGYQSTRIDVVGYEALMDSSTQDDPALVARFNAQITAAKSRIGNRPIFLTVQAYNRNGAWSNLASLKTLQTPPYLHAYDDPRVVGLLLFSYGRSGGTRELGPRIRTEHQRIWRALR